MPRWIAALCLFAVACATSSSSTSSSSSREDPPPGGASLEAQIRAGKPSLLAGVKDRAAQKAIMKEMTRELGATCDDCHDVTDFAAPTVRKKIANLMFVNFSVPLEARSHPGAPLRCAYCHEGKSVFLGDRADKERISALMKARFV